MIGKELNHLYSRKSTWPKFLKFTQENIPVPLENDETIQLVPCGIQNVILVTNHSKCYLFGDFKFGSYNSNLIQTYKIQLGNNKQKNVEKYFQQLLR